MAGTDERQAARIAGMSDFLQVTMVADTHETATRIARSAVRNRFAASAQVLGQATSIFWHLGELGEGQEWIIVLKTEAARYADLREHLLAEHPWDNPEITAIEITHGTEAYFEWIRRTVGPDA
jgi:periplasmic divalent cation tolerance protein